MNILIRYFLLGLSLSNINNLMVYRALTDSIISGHVSDLFGKPIQEAVVRISNEHSDKVVELHTDSKGKYTAAHLQAGSYIIRVSSLGFYKEEVKLSLGAGEQKSANFGLVAGDLADIPPAEIVGLVNSSDGNVVQNANVTIVNPFNQKVRLESLTNNKGTFIVQVKHPGQYVIFVSAVSNMISISTIVVPASLPRQKIELEFSLKPLG